MNENVEIYILKSKENLQIAKLAFDNNLFNSCANRAYYAAFQAAISCLFHYRIKIDSITHKTIQSLFVTELIHKRKIIDTDKKSVLSDLQFFRNKSDYEPVMISKRIANNLLKTSLDFCQEILKGIYHD